jgi:3-methyl-2-oxobutanoate hydroxymethyltransferase
MQKTTVPELLKKKAEKQKITMLTAYDYPFARILDEAGIDGIIVGDSLGMVVQGLENTLPVTMDEMIYHTRIVSRGVRNAMVIGDMPFMSYQTSLQDAVRNAGRFLKEGGASVVKIEGGSRQTMERIKAVTSSEIPVMAHIGLTPQSIHRMGGFKVQGKSEDAANKLIEEALMAEDAGAFAILLEGIPATLAERITNKIAIPTIGIGAGPHCDGQVLVLHDVIGLFERFLPKFAKRYANLKAEALKAVQQYREEVVQGTFPSDKESF